ncbi:PREDICTED: PDZ and LIM domain protein Zasp isoform X4 [Trachymyrmex septentrionalis]|uniref:PDZ and LIM domain protein Zasp isoform X4 n=1 Tax=Trachymyrmex septentrionalis TaxID=34720 RepID=UPI00084EF8A2|nr:PREDICTED: PDZ and LIM domain protein Zasp isoform X4 [Trachymyrmex septentrionalis]
MAQLIGVKLSRFDGSPWGFRLQGGKDFGTPLIVQKVNSGSPAEAAGLKAGDAVIRVNTTDMYNLRHKDAQDVIVKAGNNFEITVQRGGSTWKPHVTPATTSLPSPMHTAPAGNITPVTKTSLAAKKQDGPLIGSGHNFSPKPFLNGTGDGPIKSIVNKQYNSPVGIYSEETIAETLSAQAEVLAGGVLGVNFKKNEKNYNAENSEVFKMVQEADKEPKTPEPVPSRTEFYSSVSHAVGGRATSPRSPTPLFHAMGGGGGSAPADSRHFVWMDESYGKNREPQPQKQESSAGSGSSTPGGVVCSNCDRVIVGVFVRIKDKNLHVECFKCSTCGTSLKNVGYYNINNKLYCDIHAKLVARQNAPAGLVPLTIPPGGKAPASTISAALASAPLSPPLSNHGSSPQPFSACNRTSPESGFQHTWRSTSNTNGCIKNGECNGESKTFTSTITIQTGGTEPTRFGTPPVDSPSLRSVQAPTSNNLVGPKPFGGSSAGFSSNLSPPPTLNSGSNTLPRPQSQTVTGRYSTLPKPKSSPFRGTGIGGLGSAGSKTGSFAGSSAPKRGRGILNQAVGAGSRIPLCAHCNSYVRGPFITALGQIWCPDHFVCVNAQCRRPLQDIGFVEEKGQLYCEYCFEKFIAPTCNKCNTKIKGDCLNAIGKHFHPECFNCAYCGKLFGNNPFFLEEGLPYCEADWNELFTTKCFACGFPVEVGDRWVEALNNNYHSQCFNCTMCKKNLEGQSFYAKGGRPFCKNHAR